MNISIDTDSNFEKTKAEKDKMFRDFLPIEIVGDTGAVIIGNPETPSLLITHYKSMSGTYEVVQVTSNIVTLSLIIKVSIA